ncbi:unnamed protein product [Oreochromis niloticus]|nr:unnamed protein product [Mustela putorius furo]
MAKYLKDTKNVNIPPLGRWIWNDKSKKLEFISSYPREESVLTASQTNNNFKELQERAEWLADIFTMNHRGRQRIRSRLSPAHFNAYRSSVLKRQGDRVTIEDVKQVAVGLLQENYLLPIPLRFLELLKSEELDEVLITLLLYLSSFFEHKTLKNKSVPRAVKSEHQMMAEAWAKKEMAQKMLAVCCFRLMMDLKREQHRPYHKRQISSNRTEWLLHACLYSFFCYVAWVTFGRRDLKDIQEEVGRLLYSDSFNMAVKNMTDGDSGTTSNGSLETGAAHSKMRHNSLLKRSTSQRHPLLSSIVNQRSPLMVSLLPSPKEQSPHLFLGSRARNQIPLKAEYCDTKALMEQLDQQLASVRFGILGKPLDQFSHSTLLPCGQQKPFDEDKDKEVDSDVNNSADHSGICAQGTELSFVGFKSMAFSDMEAPST